MDAKTSEQKFDYLQDIRTALIIVPENTYSQQKKKWRLNNGEACQTPWQQNDQS